MITPDSSYDWRSFGEHVTRIVLQPMTLFSAWEPPSAPRFELMRHHPRTSLGRSWNRIFFSLVRVMLRRRYGRDIDAVRAEHGLAPTKRAPMLDLGSATAATLCCWSSVLGRLPTDAPRDAALIGFPFFDSESGGQDVLAPELASFLGAGDPPLVFTLGSFAVSSPGRFYEEAAAVSRMLGRRAVLLTGQSGAPRLEGDTLFMGYAPHSAVFPQAAIIVHHGGIGTTGQALRAGRPQVIVPHFGDQFDNAVRVESAGVGVMVKRERFERIRLRDTLSDVLSDTKMADAAILAAEKIASEDGTADASRRISALSA